MADLPTGTVTLLFTDIEGSMRLHQQLGDRYASLLAECRQLLRATFQQWNGHEVDTQGDAFFVAFARATDAISAAVAAQRALFTYIWPEGVTVRVRIGLHTCEPFVATEGYVGLDAHRAACIMSAGHGGQVLLSQTTRDLLEQALPEGISLLDLGAHRLKDLQQPSQLFQLVIVGLPADFPPPKTLDSHPNNLPIQPTSLIGREKEVATVQYLLRREDVRLLTLTGLGGIGKTRLGLQVAAELADQYPDGVFLVSLAPVSESAQVVPAIIQTLSISEAAGGQPPLALLKTALKDKHLLLLLDNFEQVITAAVQVAELLAACPKLKIIMTSRVMLHVQTEREFAVPPLSIPNLKHLPDLVTLSQYEAVALFIQRAQVVKSDFAMTDENAAAIAQICYQLDGLPLAIELAAGRSKLFSPQALLPRLANRLKLLVGGAQDLPLRQQTLRGTIAWSYDLLEEVEKKLFRRLAVFVGGCTLEGAQAVCNADQDLEEDVLDGVSRLVDKSLLRQETTIDGEPRLLMLETIREYALERLAESGETEALLRQHATFFLAMAKEADLKLRSAEQSTWRRRLDAEHDNLRAALQWALEHQFTGLQLPSVLLLSTAGSLVDLASLPGRTVVYCYSRTASPYEAMPDGWDLIPGARGCTPQSCAFRDHYQEFQQAGATQVFGLSTQTSSYQQEAVQRLHLPFALLSDVALTFTHALSLPTFEIAGMTLIKRLTLIIDDGTIVKVFYPVFPPVENATEVLHWLLEHPRQGKVTIPAAMPARPASAPSMKSPTPPAGLTAREEASSDLPSGILSSPPLSPHRALKQYYSGLTSREREVACLVAQGKSNHAIAYELVVGVSTVEAHITHIFTKLGFASRAQIAAWAVDKGLTQAPQDLEVPRQNH